MRIKYKVVRSTLFGKYSAVVKGKAKVKYKKGKWATAPKWLAELGYYPLVFSDIEDARKYATTKRSLKIYRCIVREQCELPNMALPYDVSRGKIVKMCIGFPKRTEMWKEVKILEVIKGEIAMNRCRICGKKADLRFGVCFDCIEAESIIADGLDMYDKGLNGTDKPARTALDKLQLLIQKGWHYGNSRA